MNDKKNTTVSTRYEHRPLTKTVAYQRVAEMVKSGCSFEVLSDDREPSSDVTPYIKALLTEIDKREK